MTPSQLKLNVSATGSNFFDRKIMSFFGDTMRNYSVCRTPVPVRTLDGTEVLCWVLIRKSAVKNGNVSSAYFNASTFGRVFPAK